MEKQATNSMLAGFMASYNNSRAGDCRMQGYMMGYMLKEAGEPDAAQYDQDVGQNMETDPEAAKKTVNKKLARLMAEDAPVMKQAAGRPQPQKPAARPRSQGTINGQPADQVIRNQQATQQVNKALPAGAPRYQTPAAPPPPTVNSTVQPGNNISRDDFNKALRGESMTQTAVPVNGRTQIQYAAQQPQQPQQPVARPAANQYQAQPQPTQPDMYVSPRAVPGETRPGLAPMAWAPKEMPVAEEEASLDAFRQQLGLGRTWGGPKVQHQPELDRYMTTRGRQRSAENDISNPMHDAATAGFPAMKEDPNGTSAATEAVNSPEMAKWLATQKKLEAFRNETAAYAPKPDQVAQARGILGARAKLR